MFEIKEGVPRPTAAPQQGTNEKYPTAKLKVGQYFIVPKSEMKEDETPHKFRNRVNQAVRTYRQRVDREAPLDPDYDENTYQGPKFSVITLGPPDRQKGQDWEEGDVGVWRDA